MSVTKLPYGKPVKLLIDFKGFSDGRIVLFEIWKKKGGKKEKVTEAIGVTKGGKGIGKWIPGSEESVEVMPLEKQIQERVEQEKYYFIAKIDDQQARSGDLVFTYPLDIYLKKEWGQPIDGVGYLIRFSDGSMIKGVFKDGHARIEDAPSGKFKLELDENEFVDESLGSAGAV